MRRVLAAIVACSVAGCSLLSTRAPLAPDRPGDCTTSYRPVRVDTWTGIALIAPLVALGLFALVDASSEPEDGPPDPVNGKQLLLPTAAAFAVGVPFAISAGRRVDDCRRARGMLTGDEELAARRAEEARQIAACHAAGPAGAPSMVTLAGPDTEVHACRGSGVVAVRGSGVLQRLPPRCAPFDAHPGCRSFDVDDRIIARTAGVTVRKAPGDADCARAEAADRADDEVDVIHVAIDDWADADAVLAVARAELAQWSYGPGVVVRIAVAPACDEPTR